MNINPYIYSQNLMQKAAKTCYNFIIDIVSNQRILVVCGPGNNGGDGILIAKYLHDKKKHVELYSPLGMAKTDDSSKALALLNSSFPIKQSVHLEDYDIIIDSVFGLGLSRSITKELQILFQNLNDSRARVISIDMPSGVQTDTGQVDSMAI